MSRSNLVHAIANCEDCDWQEHDYRVARKRAYQHAKKHGHKVTGETAYYFVYNGRAAKSEERDEQDKD